MVFRDTTCFAFINAPYFRERNCEFDWELIVDCYLFLLTIQTMTMLDSRFLGHFVPHQRTRRSGALPGLSFKPTPLQAIQKPVFRVGKLLFIRLADLSQLIRNSANRCYFVFLIYPTNSGSSYTLSISEPWMTKDLAIK